MSNAPTLQRFGDRIEQANWGHLKKLIPHYEVFWRLYVLPLRSGASIWFQEGIDPQIETIAIANYSTFAALSRARHKIYTANEHFRHIEELYMAIQRSLELGIKLVDEFGRLELRLLHSKSCISSASGIQRWAFVWLPQSLARRGLGHAERTWAKADSAAREDR